MRRHNQPPLRITYSGLELLGGPPARLDVLVSPKAATVSGVARHPESDRTAVGITVVLVPKEAERAQISQHYHRTDTDQHGSFTFRNVVPGEYKVYA